MRLAHLRRVGQWFKSYLVPVNHGSQPVQVVHLASEVGVQVADQLLSLIVLQCVPPVLQPLHPTNTLCECLTRP